MAAQAIVTVKELSGDALVASDLHDVGPAPVNGNDKDL